jgi:hypothetical protein
MLYFLCTCGFQGSKYGNATCLKCGSEMTLARLDANVIRKEVKSKMEFGRKKRGTVWHKLARVDAPDRGIAACDTGPTTGTFTGVCETLVAKLPAKAKKCKKCFR